MKMRECYLKNKESRVGDICTCPSCGTVFVKETYHQSFCKTRGGTKCKDKYWNTVTPQKRCNTTRISPANQRYYENVICQDPFSYGEHPFSGLNDEQYKFD